MKKLIFSLLFFVIAFTIAFYQDSYKDKMMRLVNESDAIVLKVDEANFSGAGIYVKYEVNDCVYKNQVSCKCEGVTVGDTVLVEYAKDDPTYIRLKE